MSQIKVSILIPVYNSSKFLQGAFDAIKNQTFNDFEAIFVDDGSTDDSLEMISDFAKEDSRVKVFSKENGGSATSRNMALKESNGEYIAFFDPDDYISPNLLELAYENISHNDSDIVVFKADAIDDDNNIDRSQSFFNLDGEFHLDNYENFSFVYKDIRQWVMNRNFAPWAKLYKKEFLNSYDDFLFDEGVSFEDIPFHIKAMLRANKISFVNEYLYHWRCDNLDSVSKTPEFCYDIFKIMDLVYELLKKENQYESFELEYNMFEISHGFIYILTADSDDYFNLAKDRVSNIDESFVPKMPEYIRDRYDLIMSSDNLDEFKINNSTLPFKKSLDNLKMENSNLKEEFFKSDRSNEKLKDQLKNSRKLTAELLYNVESLKMKNLSIKGDLSKINKNNEKLKDQLKKSQKLNDELLSSNSWKITEPLRILFNFFK